MPTSIICCTHTHSHAYVLHWETSTDSFNVLHYLGLAQQSRCVHLFFLTLPSHHIQANASLQVHELQEVQTQEAIRAWFLDFSNSFKLQPNLRLTWKCNRIYRFFLLMSKQETFVNSTLLDQAFSYLAGPDPGDQIPIVLKDIEYF